MNFNTLICKLGLHSYDDVTHRPCERFKTCKTCGKEKVYKGWHMFENSGDVYYERVTYTYDGDSIDSVIYSKRKRICKNCKLMDVVTLQ